MEESEVKRVTWEESRFTWQGCEETGSRAVEDSEEEEGRRVTWEERRVTREGSEETGSRDGEEEEERRELTLRIGPFSKPTAMASSYGSMGAPAPLSPSGAQASPRCGCSLALC